MSELKNLSYEEFIRSKVEKQLKASNQLMDDLKELMKWYQEGRLTDEEFEQAKAKLLKK